MHPPQQEFTEMSDVYVIGVSCTAFAKRPDASFKDLSREAYEAALADAGLDDGALIDSSWFGNCGMDKLGQPNIRGQVCFTPLVREGRFPERIPMINVEGGCATASMAFNGAWKDVLSGQSQMALAIGVEKTFVQDDPARTQAIFAGGIDQLDPQEWHDYYRRAGELSGKPFEPDAGGLSHEALGHDRSPDRHRCVQEPCHGRAQSAGPIPI
jgi:acetyl-CoA acetyltransferase